VPIARLLRESRDQGLQPRFPPAGAAINGSKTFSGYSVGGGLEVALGGNLFLKGEYRYADLGRETILSQPWNFEPFVATQTDEPSIHSLRAVLTYKFSGGDARWAGLPRVDDARPRTRCSRRR
jgi:hypothetical protein